MKILRALMILVALVLTGLGLRYFALPAYRHHKEQRLARQLPVFMERKDYRNASIVARQIRRLNAKNIEALRASAQLEELSRSPHALNLWRRIVELSPTIENKLNLAAAAMRLQSKPYTMATQLLEELRSDASTNAAYHAVTAELALRQNQPQRALSEYEQATQLEPTNQLHQLNAAVLRLRSTNQTDLAAARATLETLKGQPLVGTPALRWLVTDSLDNNDLGRAREFSSLLVADSGTMDDRILQLTILDKSGDPALKPTLLQLESKARTNAFELYYLSRWLVTHGRVEEAFEWMTNCPTKVRAEQPAPLAMVECLAAKREWPQLEQFLLSQKWGDRDFLRLAFLSRTAEQQKERVAVDARWRAALQVAEDKIGPLTMLLDLATAWNRPGAREEVLWAIANRCPREQWALRELQRTYEAQMDTRGLNKVSSSLSSRDPKDLRAANDFAATSMLLKANLTTAHQLAKEIYATNQTDAFVASTYAYSLHLQGRTPEALGVLEKLKPESLESPAVALYYGLLLKTTGQTNKAEKYFSLAQKASLLPEEKMLLAAATGKP